MTETSRPNEILSHAEREALHHVRRRANRSRWLPHQLWPLAVVLVVLGIMMAQGSGALLLLSPVAVVVVYVWNSYRQGMDEIAVAIDGLCKLAEEAERRRHSPP